MVKEKTKELENAEADLLAKEIVKILIEKLAIDISMFDAREYTTITDFYVNATGRSLTHVAALADEVVDNIEMRGLCANRVEGKRGNSWILVDFGSVIVNIFDGEGRNFYNFDRLLPAESKCDITELVAQVDKKFE